MSRVHPIFEIQELIGEIVSWMPPRQTIHTALVNRTWFHASIPYLWYSVSLKGALSLLGKWGMCRDRFGFLETPTETQWDLFLVYSKHVRLLEGISLEGRLLQAATRFRPDSVTYLFPNLRVLIWTTMGDLTDLNALISPSLESFGLKVPELTASSFQRLCHLLITRLKVLRFLDIDVLVALKADIQCHHLFQELLEHFKETLMWIQIPSLFYTHKTLKMLSKIQHLCNLSIGPDNLLQINEIPVSWTDHKLIERRENFHSLQKFSFTGTQKKLCDKLLTRYSLSALLDFTWHSCTRLDDPEFLITIMVSSCPHLETLTVGHSQMYPIIPFTPPVIHWPAIRPLLRLQNLSTLSLNSWTIQMTPENLIELLSSRPPSRTWKILEIFTSTPLRLADLSLYNQYCPDLERLGIYIDGYSLNSFLAPSDHDERDIDQLLELHLLPHRRFSQLAVINFGYSQLHWKTSLAISSILLKLSEIPIVATGWDWPYWREVSARVLARWKAGKGNGWDAALRSERSTPTDSYEGWWNVIW
ncbi:hypothetical protein Clacol_005038 [Clathrus columnatus]|uniref:F-box domain-containing protein n=1 Tax=Clathrus columnatus TaxID=1419009 RepID=A0AAV5AFU3_9AGAM|nr:hypothetical protein Clacol_005038 [Clathrus columnatus]